MGIQAHFDRRDFESAGLILEDCEEVYVYDDEPSYTAFYTRVTFPDGHVHVLHRYGDETLWIDFNHWGSNRPALAPRLHELGIKWRES